MYSIIIYITPGNEVEPGMTTATVLIVEDDYEQARLFARVLELRGYTVETVVDAAQAQARLTAEPFVLLLADRELARGMSGDALIVWAKSQVPAIKTILFSNHLQVEELASACGADAAYRKIDGIVRLRQLVADLAPTGVGHG